jgi:hypothetical protein
MENNSPDLSSFYNNGYPVNVKPLKDLPCVKLPKERNFLSEQLYEKNININRITELVKLGAVINYRTYEKGSYASMWPIPHAYAFDKTEKGLKKMKTIIELGAELHNIEGVSATPLTIAIGANHGEMIELLMPYENPVVTLYSDKIMTNIQEQLNREEIIKKSFYFQNIRSIQLLLQLGLMTANRGLREFAYYMKPNQEILNILLKNGATNINDVLSQVKKDAFPLHNQYVEFFQQICTAGAFSTTILDEMHSIKEQVNAIIKTLESNKKNTT